MKAFKMLGDLAQQPVIQTTAIAIAGSSLLFFLILAFMPRPFYREGFRNLQELQNYAASTNELEPMSNNNTLKPEFEQHYKKFKLSFAQKLKEKITYLFSFIGITKQPVWSVSFFKTLLEIQAKERTGKGLAGNFIGKITTTENSNIIVFGNLQGAFHSFVRYLTQLKELGIINDNLQIIKQDCFVVFMGNVINRSCYSMETLAAVARFVQVNPDKAIFLRGNHESNNYWQEHNLKTELQIRAAYLSKANIPLEEEVNNYFNTLPMAAYLTIPDAPTDFIRISHLGRTQSELLNENNYANFLTESSPQPSSFTTIKEKSGNDDTDTPIAIKVIIRGEKKRETFQTMEGLRLLQPDMDSVAWNILSCPTFVFQKAIKFYHDAFVIITANRNLEDWKITLYSRDSRTKDPFKATTYLLLSGINTATNKQLEQEKPFKKESGGKERSIVPRSVEPMATQTAPQAETIPLQIQTTMQPTQPKKIKKVIVKKEQPTPHESARLEKIESMVTQIKETVDQLHEIARSRQPTTNQLETDLQSQDALYQAEEQTMSNDSTKAVKSKKRIKTNIGSGILNPNLPTMGSGGMDAS